MIKNNVFKKKNNTLGLTFEYSDNIIAISLNLAKGIYHTNWEIKGDSNEKAYNISDAYVGGGSINCVW